MSEAEGKFLENNPELIDLPQPPLRHRKLRGWVMSATAKRTWKEPARFSITTCDRCRHRPPILYRKRRPLSLLPQRSEQNPSIYSAPASREVPTGGYREPSPSQVRLTPEEKETAEASGISATEYAKMKLRLEREKRAGQRQV